MTDQPTLNVKRMIDSLGGTRAVASLTGRTRGGVYYWIKTNRIGSDDLTTIWSKTRIDWTKFVERGVAE